ncbi:hypothetical protein X970_24630 [Pseudomonas monteilii SB3101]|uniref:Uncharacterized protein n=1 Tax=Pseudomonas monteilii SB3101 TaxID=1435058 RepID=V9V9X7_9PSED|nr:hypothetical protein X969_24995 [Pseudomonas monteilii SB3078]AHC91193.1 hypothetical protein X970_24630 [Pseudomonas monteilii SB3101]
MPVKVLMRCLWEWPCVAKGPQRGPRIFAPQHKSMGLLRSSFATQGRSYITE